MSYLFEIIISYAKQLLSLSRRLVIMGSCISKKKYSNLYINIGYYVTVATILVATVLVSNSLTWQPAQAESRLPSETQIAVGFNLDTAGSVAGVKTDESLGTRVGKLVAVVLRFLGIIFILIMIAGGLIWMTAAGNEEKIAQAKKLIVAGAVGFIITFMSYTIAQNIPGLMWAN